MHKLMSCFLLMSFALACGQQAQDVSKVKDAGELYVCVANSGFESKTYTKFGDTHDKAYADAVRECHEKSGNVCTARCRDNTIDTLLDSSPADQVWACLVRDQDTRKSWVRTGSSYQRARQNAEDYCVNTKAGTRCVVESCSPAA